MLGSHQIDALTAAIWSCDSAPALRMLREQLIHLGERCEDRAVAVAVLSAKAHNADVSAAPFLRVFSIEPIREALTDSLSLPELCDLGG